MNHGPASTESSEKGQIICCIKTASGWQSLGEAGNGQSGLRLRQDVHEVIGGGFAFHVRTGGENHFVHGGLLQPMEQGGNAEIFGPNVVQWAEAPMQGMIMAFESPGAFQRKDVGGLLNDADDRRIP